MLVRPVRREGYRWPSASLGGRAVRPRAAIPRMDVVRIVHKRRFHAPVQENRGFMARYGLEVRVESAMPAWTLLRLCSGCQLKRCRWKVSELRSMSD